MQIAQDNVFLDDQQIYYRQKLNDTIFKIDESKSIAPYLVVHLGKLKSPFLLLNEEQQKKYVSIKGFHFTDNFYYIQFSGDVKNSSAYSINFLMYNRKVNEAFFLDEHTHLYYGEEFGTTPSPINDLDGLRDAEILFNYQGGICAQAIDIPDAKPYVESDRFDPTKLSTDKYYKKVKKLLDESDIEDNPIIRICYLK